MKKLLAATALAAGVVGLTGCGPGYTTVSDTTYCVNQMTGQVEPPQYCQVGSSYYNPMLYDYWVGNTYGHHYGTGVVIQHNYFVKGKTVNPSSSSARKAAGLPVSGSVSNGVKSSTTTRQYSTPAKPQQAPVSGRSTTKSTTSTTTRSTGGFSSGRTSSGSTSRSSTFGSTSRSTSGFSSRSSFGSSSRRP